MKTDAFAFSEPTSAAQVLSEATSRAAEELGLSRNDLSAIVGRHRSRLRDDIDPDSKTGELALLFVRVYRGLYSLVGGNKEIMHRWVGEHNRGTGGVPAQQMCTVSGLVRVLTYIDGMRGRL